MRRALLAAGAGALALVSGLALAQNSPESLLPPGFDDPKPAAPAPKASARPDQAAKPGAGEPSNTSMPVVQPVPSSAPSGPLPAVTAKLPSIEQLNAMSTDQLDELLGLKPKIDIPPGARHSLAEVGVLAPAEGGLPTFSLAKQPASLVRAVLAGTKRPLVSRWGHILFRRALASRLAAPPDMDPVEFAALRISALNAIGEFSAARAVAQDVDTANWNPQFTSAALDAYIGSADLVGACPAVRLQGSVRKDANWRLFQGICAAYAGEGVRAKSDLNLVRSRGQAASIDALLAERFAGAAGSGQAAVTIEWNGVDELTPMRFALANAVGETVPKELLDGASPYYSRAAAIQPMLGLPQRAAGADLAAREGILSSAAMVDLYSLIYTEEDVEGPLATTAQNLHQAYVGADAGRRMAAIRDVWSGGAGAGGAIDYARLVLTAYAAARVEPLEDLKDDAGNLVAAMLAAGLERDALLWAKIVPQGSEAWGQLVFAAPQRAQPVANGAIDDFVDADKSKGKRKSQFLVAGLAGLGRMDGGAVSGYSKDLGMRIGGETHWTNAIDKAAAVDNQALVALLVGVGMQGDSWDQMTSRYLYHIVAALNRVGLSAEARMIAAEAVARG